VDSAGVTSGMRVRVVKRLCENLRERESLAGARPTDGGGEGEDGRRARKGEGGGLLGKGSAGWARKAGVGIPVPTYRRGKANSGPLVQITEDGTCWQQTVNVNAGRAWPNFAWIKVSSEPRGPTRANSRGRQQPERLRRAGRQKGSQPARHGTGVRACAR